MKLQGVARWMVVGFAGVEAVGLVWFVLNTLGRI